MLAADAATRTGDDRHLAVQQSHVASSLSAVPSISGPCDLRRACVSPRRGIAARYEDVERAALSNQGVLARRGRAAPTVYCTDPHVTRASPHGPANSAEELNPPR